MDETTLGTVATASFAALFGNSPTYGADGAGSVVSTYSLSVPADGTAATVGPALNAAANQVAADVAKWIGG